MRARAELTGGPGGHERGLVEGGWEGRGVGYEKRALFGNNADTQLHPHLHSSP